MVSSGNPLLEFQASGPEKMNLAVWSVFLSRHFAKGSFSPELVPKKAMNQLPLCLNSPLREIHTPYLGQENMTCLLRCPYLVVRIK